MIFKTWCLGVLVVIFVSPIASISEVLTVDELTTPLRIDGHLATWPSTRMILLNQASQIVDGKIFWKDEDDFNGRIFLTYDSEYLYIAAIVTKRGTAMNNNEKLSLWNGDCLELFLSTNPDWKTSTKPSRWDYHIGLSPGTGCKNPQVWCFNKNKGIEGARLVARATKQGYLMECAIPFLPFFEGLDLGPGKSVGLNIALDEGGSVGGNRIVRMDYTGRKDSLRNPSLWAEVQWIGKTVVTVPKKSNGEGDSEMVQDGTRGATYLGSKGFQGKVLDTNGKALDGAKIFTWPWTDEVTSDANGNFEFEKIKVYDNTVVYARKDGYATSLASFTSKSSGITVSLSPLPDSVSTGGLVNGLAIDLSGPSSLDKMIAGTESRVSALKPGFIRLSGMETTGPSRDAEYEALDRFISYVKKIGAEPILGVSLGKSPEEAGALVRYCNLEKGYHVRYWAIGNEPDLLADKDPSKSDYNVYDYVNDFREFYNAMKQADPSIWVMGPELAWKYEEGTNDWITPFLQYNGDIVNMISIHHYAALNPAQTTLQTLWGDPRKLLAQLRHLQDQISENEDVSIPLAFTGGNIYSAGGAATISNSVTLLSISPALWMGDEMGLFSKEGISTNLFSFTKEKGTAGFMADSGVHPAYEVLKTFNALFKGDVLPTQTQMEGIAAYAIRDPGSKNIVLMIISKKNYYSRLNISFDGKGSDLIVDGGLNRKINYEVPSYSISFLKIRADHSSDQVWLYTQKMAVANIVPEMKSLKE